MEGVAIHTECTTYSNGVTSCNLVASACLTQLSSICDKGDYVASGIARVTEPSGQRTGRWPRGLAMCQWGTDSAAFQQDCLLNMIKKKKWMQLHASWHYRVSRPTSSPNIPSKGRQIDLEYLLNNSSKWPNWGFEVITLLGLNLSGSGNYTSDLVRCKYIFLSENIWYYWAS